MHTTRDLDNVYWSIQRKSPGKLQFVWADTHGTHINLRYNK